MKTAEQKPEHMTSLSGKRLVSKTHRRIAFRGILDSLEAELIEAQILAMEKGETDLCAHLGEVLDYCRAIMAAEVKETPLPPPFLFGMDAEEIHRKSHQPMANGAGGKAIPLPDYTQGALAARINTLRAKIREAELVAVRAFGPEEQPEVKPPSQGSKEIREDIILALKRLSSALWLLFCWYVSE